ncbi:MAG: DUF4150 domain-containing protein [Deltaproteobacteria bacterium]|jgi:hypothetical protein|nr:DUF4150 domain-containing protein [Deltaproteobacteria bacterium]
MFALTLKPGVVTSLAPDVCKIPSPPAPPVPTPFVNMFQYSQANPGTISTKVMLGGAQAFNVQTKIPMSQGDEAGTLGGMISNMIMGPCWFSPSGGSLKVMIEGKPALPMGAQSMHNGDATFNTTGMASMPTQPVVMVN